MAVTVAPEQYGRISGQSLERDPRWQLIQRIVATPGFVRSPRLISFLLFVTERSLIGEAQEINEQSIGVGIFGRTSGYDSNDDNIVRSHASRLRQKLEAYFQGEGSAESLRVSIPKGSYVPVFYESADTPAPESVAADFALVPEPSTRPFNGTSQPALLESPPILTGDEQVRLLPSGGDSVRETSVPIAFWIGAAAACVLSIVVTCLLMTYWHRTGETGIPVANHALWRELLDGRQDTLIVNGDSSLVLYENITGKTLTIGEYISGNYRDQVAPQDKTDPHLLRTIARRRLTSIVDLAIANRITGRPELAPGHAVLRYARDLHVDDLKSTNVILIGSQEANPWVQLYADSLNFTLIPDQQTKVFTIYNRAPKQGEAAEYHSAPGDPDRRAYAAIALVKNLDGAGRTLIIQGTGMAGTEAAADYVLGRDELSSLLHGSTSLNGSLPDFEILLETSNLGGNAPKSKLVAMRVNGK
jgi:hypothetical protein